TLRDALETVRQELETTAKEHIGLSQKIKVELEQELSDFITKQREKRKLQQSVVEKSLRNKQTQISSVQKAREKYESECLKLPGLLESKKTVVGKDLEKLSLKIEKTQLAAKAADQEYMQMVKIATDATQKWNDDWRLACEKFQYLEEDRIEFLKQELWNYANLISSICVVDDESCERIRVCLENCNVDKDIQTFIKEHATGPEIPGENGTRYKRASYERTSMEYKNNVLPPGTDQPIGNSQNTNYNLISSTNSNQSSQENGMNYKTLYNFLPVEKSSRATLYANTSSASPHGTIKDSVLPQTPIEEIEEPDPIDPRQQTILAVGENMLEVQTTNEDSMIENDLKSGSSSPIANTVESVEDMPQLNNQQTVLDRMEK
ncbi:4715_t:CDS:2, partial [Scutellospora calospora]